MNVYVIQQSLKSVLVITFLPIHPLLAIILYTKYINDNMLPQICGMTLSLMQQRATKGPQCLSKLPPPLPSLPPSSSLPSPNLILTQISGQCIQDLIAEQSFLLLPVEVSFTFCLVPCRGARAAAVEDQAHLVIELRMVLHYSQCSFLHDLELLL